MSTERGMSPKAVLHEYGPRKFLALLLHEIKYICWNIGVYGSYSQDFEDIIIDDLLCQKEKGIYVDIGCHEPKRLSNTYRFYRKGWFGLCVDPNPQCVSNFKRLRHKDMIVMAGVGAGDAAGPLYIFGPHALSTFVKKKVNENQQKGHKVESTQQVPIYSLSNILDSHLKDKKIDLLSIDVEGMDLEVLQSNDWQKYKPTLICVESESSDEGAKIRSFLEEKDYVLIVSTKYNDIYRTKLS